MSTLILVRHGQACAFSDDPDQLSSVGWKQSRQLGRYWASHGIVFDAVFYGTLKRQRETCHAISEEYATQGLPWPEARELMGLDEYHAQEIVSEMAPRLADHDKSFAELWNSWNSSTGILQITGYFRRCLRP